MSRAAVVALVLAVACAGALAQERFSITIDAYSDGFDGFELEEVGSQTLFQDGLQGVIGGAREVSMNMTEKAGARSSASIDVTNQNQVELSIGTGATAFAVITWDGPDGSDDLDTAGLGGEDLTRFNQDAFAVEIAFWDRSAPLRMFAYDVDGSMSTFDTEVPSGIGEDPDAPPFMLTLPYANFTGSADFTRIGALRLVIGPRQALDAVIKQVRTISIDGVPTTTQSTTPSTSQSTTPSTSQSTTQSTTPTTTQATTLPGECIPIDVTNFSFEDDDVADGEQGEAVSGWEMCGMDGSGSGDGSGDNMGSGSGSSSGSGSGMDMLTKGVFDPASDAAFQAREGEQVFFSKDGCIEQELAAALEENAIYNLKVDVREIDEGCSHGYRVSLLAGGEVVAVDEGAALPRRGLSEINFQVPRDHPNAGDALAIRLESVPQDGSDMCLIAFDNVRLCAITFPETTTEEATTTEEPTTGPAQCNEDGLYFAKDGLSEEQLNVLMDCQGKLEAAGISVFMTEDSSDLPRLVERNTEECHICPAPRQCTCGPGGEPYTYVDEFGCELCGCRRVQTTRPPAPQTTRPPQQCPAYRPCNCPAGSHSEDYERNGCRECTCVRDRVQPTAPVCPSYRACECPAGSRSEDYVDSNGCRACSCVRDPAPRPPSPPSPPATRPPSPPATRPAPPATRPPATRAPETRPPPTTEDSRRRRRRRRRN